MARHQMLVLTAVVVMTSVGAASQQSTTKRPYDVVMKDVGSTVATMRKSLG